MTLRIIVGLSLFVTIWLLSVALHGVILKRKGHRASARAAAMRAPLHIPHSIFGAWLFIQPLMLICVGLFIARYGGAALPKGGIHAPLYLAGGAPSYGSVLQWAPGINDQLDTNSCGGWATTEALRLELSEMGQERDWPALSGWYTYALATGGAGPLAYSSLDQEAGALIQYGHVSLPMQPAYGWPSAATRNAARNEGVSWRYLDGSLAQTERAIDLGYAPILLVPLHGDFYTAFGTDTTDLWGSGDYGTHFVVAEAYRPGAVLIANSWGTQFGSGGRIWLSTSSWSQVIAVGLVAPGAATAWPDLHAIPLPYHMPTATARPTPPRPTATPRPRSTATPKPRPTTTPTPRSGPVRPPYYRVRVAMNLRPRPATWPTSRVLIPRGSVVKAWGAQPRDHHWLRCTWHGHSGYVWRANLQ